MRFLVHTQYYPPEMGAPQARLSDLARRMRDLGHEVKVLTAIPNYPTGSILHGYLNRYYTDEIDGIIIHRCRIFPSNRPRLAHRLLSYLSFSMTSFIAGINRVEKVDLIFTESPPLFLAASGWLLSEIKGARWILNVSDLWPDSAKYIGMLEETSWTYKVLQRLAHFLYRKAWLVTGQSKEIVAEIQNQVPAARVYHLSNGVDVDRFHPRNARRDVREKYLKPGERGLVYAGLHGLFQGLDQIMEVAKRLKNAPVRFILLGDGPEKNTLMKTAKENGLENVDFYPPVPHEEMPAILASMDGALISLRSTIHGAVPSKIYEAMASAIPILLVANGEAADIVRNTGSGVAVAPGDIDGLESGIHQIIAHNASNNKMGEAGREAAEKLFDRGKITTAFAAVLCPQ